MSHYLRLNANLEEYALNVDRTVDHWQEAVFNDITEGGSKLTIEALPPNEQGDRLGLCGDKYYCEAARDRGREDCLFVFKVADANRRQPKTVPRSYPAQVYLLTSMNGLMLDPVRVLWGEPSVATNNLPSRAVALESKPSEILSTALASASKDLLVRWRNGGHSIEGEPSEEFLDRVSRPWFKFQLERFRKLTPKQESLLKKLVQRIIIGANERRQLLNVFDINLLNTFARENSLHPEYLYQLLEAIADLPLSQTLRATIWGAMVRDLTTDDFLRELYEIALIIGDSDALTEPDAWSRELLVLLNARASKGESPLLRQLADDYRGQDHPLEFLSAWVRENLEFEDIRISKVNSTHQDVVVNLPETGAKVEHPPLPSGEIPAVVGPAVDVSTSLTPIRQALWSEALDKWVMELQGVELGQAKEVAASFRMMTSPILALASDCRRGSDLVELRSLLEELKERIPTWISQLPEASRWAHDFKVAVRAYDRASSIVGEGFDVLVAGTRFTPADVTEAVKLYERRETIDALPSWVWGEYGPASTSEENSAFSTFSRLMIPAVRERVLSILSCFGEVGTYDVTLLPLLPPPPLQDEGDISSAILDDHVRTWLGGVQELLNQLPESTLSQVVLTPNPSTLLGQLKQAVGLHRKIAGRLSGIVGEELVNELVRSNDEQDAIHLSELYLEAIEFFEQAFGSALEATFHQLRGWVEKHEKAKPSSRLGAPSSPTAITVEHNWIDAQGGRVPLVFVPNVDQSLRPYGSVSLPLVLMSRQKRSYNLRLEYDVRTGHRDGWPRDWDNPAPTELLIPEDGWREDPDQPELNLYTINARIPVRRQTPRGERFELGIGITNADDGALLSKGGKFVWELMQDAPSTPLIPAWPEVIDPENVEKHPIGPQKKNREILTRLNQSGSFCVTAPRRFGKSTLVQFLAAKARDAGLVAPPAVVCTNYNVTAQGLDYQRLWQDISENLQRELGASITRPWDAGVPAEDAFDHIRRAAWKTGKKGIIILFDEAQMFFPSKSGVLLGDIVKDRLERHWSAKKDGMAPVMFGFVGLPTLQTRLGVNLSGLLRPLAQNDLDEVDLNSLILSVTSNVLNTTREARRRLARTAGNVYILRTLVDRLAEHVQGGGRAWANFDDVKWVEDSLRASLRDGREKVVPAYIRDILNDAEDVSEWKPSASLPLAIAIADAKHRGVAATRLYEEARLRLDSWYDSLASNDSTRLSYDDQQFRDHLRTLDDRGVLRNREFTSCLLEDWLLGYRKQTDDKEWSDLLRSAAIKRIKIPGSMQKVPGADGAEASVWTTTRDQEKYAYRITQLQSEEDRVRFTETREILDKLKMSLRDGARGSQYVFRVDEVGLSADSDSEAVQVYKWIDGVDLSKKLGKLRGEYVTDLGAKLSQALAFLHTSNIVHRDISPQNIILTEEGGDPIVIDFGFARRLTPALKTRLDKDCAAPEVRRIDPRWTKAADVYSLGATLLKVLNPKDSNEPLRQLLQSCVAEEQERRPDATSLAEMFERAVKDQHLDTRKKEVWDRVQATAGTDFIEKSWMRGLVEKFRGNFIGVALGCYTSQFDRCREAANFLNQLLEATSGRAIEKLSLGMVKENNNVTGITLSTDAVRFMHSVRRYSSHGEYRVKERLTSKFGNPTDEQMISMGLEAAKDIGIYVGLSSVPQVVALLLTDGGFRT